MVAKRRRKLPWVPKLKSKDPELNRFGAALNELVDVWSGNQELGQKVVTWDDLEGINLVEFSTPSGGNGPGGSPGVPVLIDDPIEEVIDLTPPAAPTGMVITGSMSSVFLSWTDNVDSVTSYYEVWRNEADTFDGNEFMIGTTTAPVFSDAVGDTLKTYYYWVRAVSGADIEGPFNVSTGDVGATGAVALTNFASGLTPVEIVGAVPTEDNFEGRTVVLTTTGMLWRYISGAWSNATDGSTISSNSIQTGSIATGAINTDQLAANAITSNKIAADQVSADHISVTNLSSINTNLGAINGGSLNINSRFVVDSSGNVTLSSRSWGARMVIQNSVIKVYDNYGNLRVKMGDLTA